MGLNRRATKKTFREDIKKHVLVCERPVRSLGIKSQMEHSSFQGKFFMIKLRRYGFVIVILMLIVGPTFAVTMFSSSHSARRDIWYWYHCRSEITVTCTSWDVALRILRMGQVVAAMQGHNLIVSLTLRDGTSVMTIEPSIDLIFQEISRCGDPCKDIRLATE